MDMVFDDEQEQFRAVIRGYLADHCPEASVRSLMESERGYDLAMWRELAGQLELPGLGIPVEYGGTGMGPVELAIVFEEFGRTLACAPLFSTVGLAANALLSCDDDAAKRRYLPAIAAGELTATLAATEDHGGWTASEVSLQASEVDGGWVLDGHKNFVIDGASADVILAPARTPDGIGVFAVSSDANGLTASPIDVLDRTRRQARLGFSATRAELIGSATDGWIATSRALTLAAVSLAAEQVGGAQRMLDLSVEYAKLRVQFGRQIGSFQAIKHKCVDMLIAVEAAKAAAYSAAWTAAADGPELLRTASLAKAYCSEVFVRVTEDAIQIHGGIGFTWEHPAHLYYRRAKTSQLYLGDAQHHRRVLADVIGV